MNLSTTTALALCAMLVASCGSASDSGSTSRHPAIGSTYTYREQFFDSAGKSTSDTTFIKTVTGTGMNVFGRKDVALLEAKRDSTYMSYEQGENISVVTADRTKGEAWFRTFRADSLWLQLPFGSKQTISIATFETTIRNSRGAQIKLRALTPTLTHLGTEIIHVDTKTLVTEKIRGDVKLIRLDSGTVPPESQFSITFWYAPQIGAIVKQEATSTDASVQSPYLSAMTRYLLK